MPIQFIAKYTNLQLKANICFNWHKANHNLSFSNMTLVQICILESQLIFIVSSPFQDRFKSHH